MANNKNFSIFTHGLNYKLKIAFYLMAIIPLLVTLYLVSNYILPRVGVKLDIVASVVISAFIAGIGFFLIREVISHIISLSSEAKLIAAGDVDHKVDITYADEVGDLGRALNQLTNRIRGNMDELKSYSEKTTQINLEIQKRILVLSNLLQISSVISQGAELDEVLRLIVEKSRFLANSDTAYLFFREEEQTGFVIRAADGSNKDEILKIKIEPHEEIFDLFAKTNKPLVFDKMNVLPEDIRRAFFEKLGLKNSLAFRVLVKGKIIGVFGAGNNQEGFLYSKEDLELLDIFSKQIAIAVENDLLLHRVTKLEIKDTLTGLYNEAFIKRRLQEEIKRANTYHRPCAFILLSIDNFDKFRKNFGLMQAEAVLKKIAFLINDSVTEIERVARFGDSEFAVVLPEKNKRQAIVTAEEIRRRVEFGFNEDSNIDKRLTVRAAVSENPLDGVEAEELIAKARTLLDSAGADFKNRVIT